MQRIISALFLCISTTVALAQNATPLELAPDAPDRHVVVRGDTLWGISSKFLRDPYRWPEIWRLNDDQIRNPHRIYPGQVVILDRSGADPQLRLGKMFKAEPQIYSDAEKEAIPTIPQNVIEPFLTQPLVIEDGAALTLGPRIVATEENRVNVGANNRIYAKGIGKPAPANLWQMYRPGPVLKDPDNGEVLGYEAIYLGEARLTREGQDGEATTLDVITAQREIGRGDSLMPAAKPEIMSYVPHAPRTAVKGRIIEIHGGVGEAGKYSIVSISRGKSSGLEQGHVLAIYRTGATVSNRFEDTKAESIRLPDERYGMLFVFRVFDRVSYALVMESSRSVFPGDVVQTP
jgi:hypothetical protein